MNNHRQLQVSGQLQLPAKNCHLHVARRIVVVEVESNFTPGDHTRTLSDKTRNPLLRAIVKQASVVRMNANGRVDILMCAGQPHRALERPAVWIASAYVQNRGNAGSAGALNNFIAILVKFRTVYVCMRIDKHLRQRINDKEGKTKSVTKSECWCSLSLRYFASKGPAKNRKGNYGAVKPFNGLP